MGRIGGDMGGEGELDEDAVHRSVRVQTGDEGQQFLLARVAGNSCLKEARPSAIAVRAFDPT